MRRGQVHGDDALDQLLRPPAVLDQVGDADQLDAVLPAVLREIGDARHCPVLVHHLTDDTRGRQAREPRQVDSGLGLPGALENAAGPRFQREDVAGLDEIGGRTRDRSRPGSFAPGRAPRSRGDAFAGLDRDRERGAVRRLVVVGHLAEAELGSARA